MLAMSSGLVASMGMPAGAVTHDFPQTGALPHTAHLPHTAAAADADASDSTFLAVPLSFISGEPVLASADATVTFDRSAFTAVPKPKRPSPAAACACPASRSAVRTVLRAAAVASTRAGSGAGVGTRSSSGSTATRTVSGGSFGSARGSSVISLAARYLGVPYRYGGTTPYGFDCSGYVQYVFARLGVSLPRTADRQYDATTRIPRSQARPGDLVFFLGAGGAYHVGIYAGNNLMYDSGKPGQVITKRAIWSATIVFGRP